MSWGTDNNDGWGSSGNNDGWGSTSNEDAQKNDSGWGSGDNKPSESKNGGWGSSDNKPRENRGGGWSSSNNDSRGPRNDRPFNNNNRDRRNGGGGPGWGSSSNNRNEPRDEGGWGSSNNDKTESKNGGGWGTSNDDDTESKNDGGWGSNQNDSEPSKNEGWGSSRNNDRDSGHDDNRKRFKRDPDADGQEERPAPYKPEEVDLDEEARLQGDGAGENFKRYQDQEVTCFPPDTIKPIEKFTDFITSELLLKNIETQKYKGMTPIQKWSVPAILNNHDLIGCAQTGSGKTAAFLLPILQKILDLKPESYRNEDCQHPYCLIISPTRELARQIYLHATMLSKDSIIKCHVIYGQIATGHLKSQLATGCHVLVATPGRLKDFVNRGWIGFKNIKYIILDEGDRLVDEGFSADIASFFSHESMPSKDERQTFFFSATFKQETQLNAKEYLKEDFLFLTVGRVGAANEDIKQEFLQVSRQEKKRELKKILAEVPESDKTIVFTQTKMAADMLAGFFTALNLSSTSIHGDRLQSQREQAIKAFRKGEKRFLISSPVGNRGLDLPKVSLVINYDLPNNIDEYVHRIGRTGRAGHTGRAISFYDAERDTELLPHLLEILEEAGQEVPEWMTVDGAPGGASSGDPEPSTAAADDGWGTKDDTSSAPAETTSAAADDGWGGGGW